jgi:hypothetical protein
VPDRSGGLGLLVAAAGNRGGDGPAPEDVTEDAPEAIPEAELVAASDVRAAVRAGSDEEFAQALARFVRMCTKDY